MEAMWHTEPAPAALTLFAIPGDGENRFQVQIPYVLGLITTRSLNTEVPGILDLVERAGPRIVGGLTAYNALQKIRADPADAEARKTFDDTWPDLGYALLLKRYRTDIENSTSEEITQAALDTVPNVPLLFWAFRVMVGLGLYFIAFFGFFFILASKHKLGENRRFLRVALFSLPLPWIAIESGWIVAEYGRQPWAIEGVLPTFYAASGLTLLDLSISLTFFLVLYTTLAIIMVILMLKTIRKGPTDHNLLVEGIGGSAFIPEGASARPER